MVNDFCVMHVVQAQFSQMRNSAVNTPPVAASPPPMFHPGAAGMGQQVFYGQPPHGLIPSQVSDLYLNVMPCFCSIMCIPI